MARNEFVPFAVGVDANVQQAETWIANQKRLLGFMAGTAKSEEFNTALRQGLFCSAMIGQFTADMTGWDVFDDGDLAEYERKFIEAIRRTGNAIDGPLRPYFIAVNSATVAAPPGNPALGDVYCVPYGATGDWTGMANYLTQWTGKRWVFVNYPPASLIGIGDTGDVWIKLPNGTWRSWYATLDEAKAGVSTTTVINPATLKQLLDLRLPHITASDYPPDDAILGDRWFDTQYELMFDRITDGTQPIWLQYTL